LRETEKKGRDKMIDTVRTIEQFWYTWSEFGYGGLNGGYRIRAVSRGLADINSERVKTLDKYARYSLPERTNPLDPILEQGKAYYTLELSSDIRPYSHLLDIEGAPISFALVETRTPDPRQSERILVNKVYVGKDQKNRPGNFFAHLLAGLPQEFTARDAIALWRSNIWQTADPQQAAGLLIEAKSLYELQADPQVSRTSWQKIHVPALNDYLCFVIHAYLQQQDEENERRRQLEKKEAELYELQTRGNKLSSRKEIAQLDKFIVAAEAEYHKLVQKRPRRIYIAAKADWVIYFVAKLTEVLPPELLEYLTFSTYEYEPQNSQCLIIGTCQPPSSQSTNTRPREILPSVAYAYEHAVNCYDHSKTPERQPIRDAEDFAQFAVDALAYEPEQIEELLKEVEESKASGTIINVKSFLKIYRWYRDRMNNLTKEDAEEIFRDHRLAYRLKKKKTCVQICDLILEDPLWFEQRFKPLVEARVASSLADKQLAEKILPVPRKQTISVLNTLAGDQELAGELKYKRFMNLLRYLFALSPVINDPGTWKALLETLLGNVQTLQFVLQVEELRMMLVAVGACVFPLADDARVFPEPDDKHLKLMLPLLAIRPTFFYDFYHKLREFSQGDLAPVWRRVMIIVQLEMTKNSEELEAVYASWPTQELLLLEASKYLSQSDERSYYEAIELLLKVNEGNFGKLLALDLRPSWKHTAVKNFNRQTSMTKKV
jgi:hypothetical protein